MSALGDFLETLVAKNGNLRATDLRHLVRLHVLRSHVSVILQEFRDLSAEGDPLAAKELVATTNEAIRLLKEVSQKQVLTFRQIAETQGRWPKFVTDVPGESKSDERFIRGSLNLGHHSYENTIKSAKPHSRTRRWDPANPATRVACELLYQVQSMAKMAAILQGTTKSSRRPAPNYRKYRDQLPTYAQAVFLESAILHSPDGRTPSNFANLLWKMLAAACDDHPECVSELRRQALNRAWQGQSLQAYRLRWRRSKSNDEGRRHLEVTINAAGSGVETELAAGIKRLLAARLKSIINPRFWTGAKALGGHSKPAT